MRTRETTKRVRARAMGPLLAVLVAAAALLSVSASRTAQACGNWIPIPLECEPGFDFWSWSVDLICPEDDLKIHYRAWPEVNTNEPCPPGFICLPCPGISRLEVDCEAVNVFTGVSVQMGTDVVAGLPDKVRTRGMFALPSPAGGWPQGIYRLSCKATLFLDDGSTLVQNRVTVFTVMPCVDGVPIVCVENLTGMADEVVTAGAPQCNLYRFENKTDVPVCIEFEATNFQTAGAVDPSDSTWPGATSTFAAPAAGIETGDLTIPGLGFNVINGSGDLDGNGTIGGDSFGVWVDDPFSPSGPCIPIPPDPVASGPQKSSRAFKLGPADCPINSVVEAPVYSRGFPLCREGSACGQFGVGSAAFDNDGDGTFGGPGDDPTVFFALGGTTDNDPINVPPIGPDVCENFGGLLPWVAPLPTLPVLNGTAFPEQADLAYDVEVNGQQSQFGVGLEPVEPELVTVFPVGLVCYWIFKIVVPPPLLEPQPLFGDIPIEIVPLPLTGPAPIVVNAEDTGFMDPAPSQPGESPMMKAKFMLDNGDAITGLEFLIQADVTAAAIDPSTGNELFPRESLPIPDISGSASVQPGTTPRGQIDIGLQSPPFVPPGPGFGICYYVTICIRTDYRFLPPLPPLLPPVVDSVGGPLAPLELGSPALLTGLYSDTDGDLSEARIFSPDSTLLDTIGLSGSSDSSSSMLDTSAANGFVVGENTVTVEVQDLSGLIDVSTYSFCLDPAAVCIPDLDPPGGDGALGFFDLVAYLTLFAAMDPAADLDPPGGDGAFGFFDLVAYLTLFAAGCP